MRQCYGEESCPLCEAPCEVQCGHSKYHKKCQEPCAPCAQNCSWSCLHRGRCQMPYVVPCSIFPCSERCGETLICGNQCSSVCGDKCPPSKYCQKCAPKDVKSVIVNYILQATYGDIEFDEDPINLLQIYVGQDKAYITGGTGVPDVASRNQCFGDGLLTDAARPGNCLGGLVCGGHGAGNTIKCFPVIGTYFPVSGPRAQLPDTFFITNPIPSRLYCIASTPKSTPLRRKRYSPPPP